MSKISPTLQAYFTQRLPQRNASPHTVEAYRDTFKLLLSYTQKLTGTAPHDIDFEQLTPELIGSFLEYLEEERHVSPSTRNARLAAIHAFFRFAGLRHPEHLHTIQRIMDIQSKRTGKPVVSFLTVGEVEALLAVPDLRKWTGRRDHALLLLTVQTGLRVSEVTSLRVGDVHLDSGRYVDVMGKGRKHRATPLTPETIVSLRSWMEERVGTQGDPLFPNSRGEGLTRQAIFQALSHYVLAASQKCQSLAAKKVGPHTLRHTAAMRLLEAGVDTSVIALWLGHESPSTTQVYLHAHLGLKEKALARTAPINTIPGRFRPSDATMAFLEGL